MLILGKFWMRSFEKGEMMKGMKVGLSELCFLFIAK